MFTVPSPPQNVRILGSTITQLKVGWDPPEDYNGVLKGYYVFLGKLKVCIHSSTITQLRVGWDPPEDYNGVLKGYYVFLGKLKELVTTALDNIFSELLFCFRRKCANLCEISTQIWFLIATTFEKNSCCNIKGFSNSFLISKMLWICSV